MKTASVTIRRYPWDDIEADTSAMSDRELCDYYASHAVRSDCRFALRDGTREHPILIEGWRRLLATITAAGKETPTHRRESARLRTEWGNWRALCDRGRESEWQISASLLTDTVTPKRPAIDWKARALAAEAELERYRQHDVAA